MSQLGRGVRPVPIHPDVRRLALSCLLLSYTGPVPPSWLTAALGEGLGGGVLVGSNLGDGTRARELSDPLGAAPGQQRGLPRDGGGADVTRLDTVRGSVSPGAAALGHVD